MKQWSVGVPSLTNMNIADAGEVNVAGKWVIHMDMGQRHPIGAGLLTAARMVFMFMAAEY